MRINRETTTEALLKSTRNYIKNVHDSSLAPDTKAVILHDVYKEFTKQMAGTEEQLSGIEDTGIAVNEHNFSN